MIKIIYATGILLILTGVINLIVGFMALFPGLIEAGVSDDMSAPQGIVAILTKRYGLYALALLICSFIQMSGGSYINLIVRHNRMAIQSIIFLGSISIGLEIWAYIFKDSLTIFSIPGLAAGILCFYILKFRDRYVG